MRVRRRRVLCGLTAALAGLPACATEAVTPGPAATTLPSTTIPAPTAATMPVPPPGPRVKKWVDLQVGDCLVDLPPTDPSVVAVTVTDCAIAHRAEVYLRAAVGVDAAIAAVADRECAAGLARYTGQSAGRWATSYLIDSDQDRTTPGPGASTVICLLQAADGRPVTGSARR